MTSQQRHRVVVGFDGSAPAQAALAWAVEEARLHGAPLVAVTVLRERPGADPAEEPVLGPLRRLAAEVAGDGVEFRHFHGSPAAGLVAACGPADLLVVGSAGGGWGGPPLGSVSRACLHHAPCPVAVIPEFARERPRYDRIVAGVDGSVPSRRALRFAAHEAALRGVRPVVVHAVHWDHLGVEFVTPTPDELISWGERLVAGELAETGVDAETEIVYGHPRQVLIEAAEEADLLVLGHSGHNPLAGLLLGSTSDHCARQAPCPVVVVRPGRDDGHG
ncbi:universal stress protein [Thermopolyspora flexuosa]|jgi:nucleotide-binding universal stress UspA family protein|uniref:Nucleotide-binding universal stress UspA family protein n=1 Tax=Thermopolyspora flexuosa TaxID=103836 RepID=A0A543ISC5_9ACTN|nr:universal stress protein [Thermopolyspora flexuosa]TQM73457.1 nucleotide-binding universal stress UspA family protein [Thermopolyspora flexuosa]GGM81312.1 universal stress protein [Thermopolyspora flexuosa]